MSATTTYLDGLARRMACGDAAARAELLALSGRRIEGLVRRMLHGRFPAVARREDTDDVVQEVRLRLLKHGEAVAASLDPTAADPLATFLFRVAGVARTTLIDLARKHFGKRFDRPPPVGLAPGGSNAPQIDPGTDTNDPRALAGWTEFHAAVGRLPDKLREVVDLRWYHALTYDEIAEVLAVPQPTVRKLWLEARLRLQTALGDIALN